MILNSVDVLSKGSKLWRPSSSGTEKINVDVGWLSM